MHPPEPAGPWSGTRKLRGRRGSVASSAIGAVITAAAAAIAVAHISTPSAAAAATATTATAPAAPGDPAGPWPGWQYLAGRGPAAGLVTSVTSTAITATTEDGDTITIQTGPATSYTRIAPAPRSAIRAGGHVLAIGERPGPAALDASAITIASGPDDLGPGDGPVGPWAPWGSGRGTISSVAGDSLTVVDAQGSAMTITLGSGTAIWSARAAGHDDISPGTYMRADNTGPADGVAQHVIIASQPLPAIGPDCL